MEVNRYCKVLFHTRLSCSIYLLVFGNANTFPPAFLNRLLIRKNGNIACFLLRTPSTSTTSAVSCANTQVSTNVYNGKPKVENSLDRSQTDSVTIN